VPEHAPKTRNRDQAHPCDRGRRRIGCTNTCLPPSDNTCHRVNRRIATVLGSTTRTGEIVVGSRGMRPGRLVLVAAIFTLTAVLGHWASPGTVPTVQHRLASPAAASKVGASSSLVDPVGPGNVRSTHVAAAFPHVSPNDDALLSGALIFTLLMLLLPGRRAIRAALLPRAGIRSKTPPERDTNSARPSHQRRLAALGISRC